MSLNLQFQGVVHNTSGTPFTGDEVNYQAFFYNLTNTSSPSKWNTVRKTEVGVYSINLGDGDWLTQDGYVRNNDRVLICFWTPTTSSRNSSDLIEWSMVEFIIDGSLFYAQHVQIKSAMPPTCLFSITGSNHVENNVIINDIGCHDIHSWIYNTKQHRQLPTIYDQNIFINMNTLPDNSISIDWDDTSLTIHDPNTSYYHKYTQPNDYNINITLTNTSNLSCTSEFIKRIYWRPPITNFIIDNPTPNPVGEIGLGELVTFTNTTTNPDERAIIDNWYWNWVINDNGEFGDFTITSLINTSRDFAPTHQWHNPDIHTISLTTHWYNGFNYETQLLTKSITQKIWSIINGLTWSTPVSIDIPITFTPDIKGDIPHVIDVDYYIDIDKIQEHLTYDQQFDHTFIDYGSYNIIQDIGFHNGFKIIDQQQSFNINITSNIISSFYDSIGDCKSIIFISNSTIYNPPIINYHWKIYDNDTNELLVELSGSDKDTFQYMWPTIANYRVELFIQDQISNDTFSKIYNITECVTQDCPPPQPPIEIVRSQIPPTSGGIVGSHKKYRVKAEYLTKQLIELPLIKVIKKKKYIKVTVNLIRKRGLYDNTVVRVSSNTTNIS
jgi:hypothetical protein